MVVSQHRLVITGNSGAGKSTLARQLANDYGLAHLDLDTLAWQPTSPPQRRELAESARDVERFVGAHQAWVVEGCYADLLALLMPIASEWIFLNPGTEACVRNCRQRPWEPHKYASKAVQDRNLDMLLAWVREYENREDEFSLSAHRRLFDAFVGPKTEYTQPLSLPIPLNDRS